MDKSEIHRIKAANPIRSVLKEFWPEYYRERGNSFAPCHHDTNPSLMINDKTQTVHCLSCGKSYDCYGLYMLKYGGTFVDAFNFFSNRTSGIKNLSSTKTKNLEKKASKPQIIPDREPDQVFPYNSADGALVYQVRRWNTPEGKIIRQRRPDGKGGWIGNLDGVEPVLFGLLKIMAKKPDVILMAEGETCALKLRELGFTATCTSGGANGLGAYKDSAFECLRGWEVWILPDNDEPGEKYAKELAERLFEIASVVKIISISPERM